MPARTRSAVTLSVLALLCSSSPVGWRGRHRPTARQGRHRPVRPAHHRRREKVYPQDVTVSVHKRRHRRVSAAR